MVNVLLPYKGTKTNIFVNGKEEYMLLMPMLNDFWRGWKETTGDSYKWIMYIDMNRDGCSERPRTEAGYETINTSDLLSLKPKEEVTNTYPIY